MDTQDIIEEKVMEEMKIRAQKLSLVEKLRAMGFTEEEITYNFAKSKKTGTIDINLAVLKNKEL